MKRILSLFLSVIMLLGMALDAVAASAELKFAKVSFTATASSVTAETSVKRRTGTGAADAALVICQYGSDGQMIKLNYNKISVSTTTPVPISATLTDIDPAEGTVKAFTVDSPAEPRAYSAPATKGTDSVSLKYIKINGKKLEAYSDGTNKYSVKGSISANEIEVLPADNTTDVEIIEEYDGLSGTVTIKLTGGEGSYRQIVISVYENDEDLYTLLDLDLFVGSDEVPGFTFDRAERIFNITLPQNTFYVRPKIAALATSEVNLTIKDKEISGQTSDMQTSYILERPCKDGLIPIKNEATQAFVTVKSGSNETRYTLNFTSRQPRLTHFELASGAGEMWKPLFYGGAAVNNDNNTIVEIPDNNTSWDNVYIAMDMSSNLIGSSLFAMTANKLYTGNNWWANNHGEPWYEFKADTGGTAYLIAFVMSEAAKTAYTDAGWQALSASEYYSYMAFGVKTADKYNMTYDSWTPSASRRAKSQCVYKKEFNAGELVTVPNAGAEGSNEANNSTQFVSIVWDGVPVEYQLSPEGYNLTGLEYEYAIPSDGAVVTQSIQDFKRFELNQEPIILPDDTFYVKLTPAPESGTTITSVMVQDTMLTEEENLSAGNQENGKPYGATAATAFYMPRANRVNWAPTTVPRPKDAFDYARPAADNIIPIKNGSTMALVTVDDGTNEKTYTFTFKAKQPMLTSFDLEAYSDGTETKTKYGVWFTGGAAVNADLGSVTGADTREFVLTRLSDTMPIIGGSLFAGTSNPVKADAQKGKIFSFTADRGGRVYLLSKTSNAANLTAMNENISDNSKKWAAQNPDWAAGVVCCASWASNEARIADNNNTYGTSSGSPCGGVVMRTFSAGDVVDIYAYEATNNHMFVPIIVWDGVNAAVQYTALSEN